MNAAFAVNLLGSLLLTWTAAASGALFRPDTWYASLRKPPGLPPQWVFPTVWTILYLLMAISAALVYRAPGGPVHDLALSAYGLQLVGNAAWSWLFFGRHRPLDALLDLAALVLLVALTLALFAQVNTLAAALLLPYLGWLCVAFYLNVAIWWLNRGVAAPESGTR